MKKILLLLFVFSIQLGFAQQDSVASRSAELKGWQLYFEEDYSAAKESFQSAIKLDSTNLLAEIGLFNSKSQAELTRNDYKLLERIPKKDRAWQVMYNLMMEKKVAEFTVDSLKGMRDKYDDAYIKFKASLMDSDFVVYDEDEVVRRTGSYKNGKPAGSWKVFDYQSKLLFHYTIPLNNEQVVVNHYKPDGELEFKEYWDGIPYKTGSKNVKKVIFWQKNPGQEPRYLFVSKEGFTVFDKENPVVFDESTPDNVIQQKWNPDTKEMEAVIWKNGKAEPYRYCEDDGMINIITVEGVRTTYRWENCEKIIVED